MIDLDTLGGAGGSGNWVNDASVIADTADLPDGTHHGFLWANGHMRDLPPVDSAPCSNSNAVNNRDEGVGNDQGEIVDHGVFRNGDQRVLLLIPTPRCRYLRQPHRYRSSAGQDCAYRTACLRGLSGGADAGPRRRVAAALSTPGMGDGLGVKVPWR
jgi:hypothetical protein